ncbi:hypothetical protein F4777DRAFT_330094 [Nemania sp. FL0916]|nr:hypothetical protein F4777DRAFT_330094 [Nemania sp. FL0916]
MISACSVRRTGWNALILIHMAIGLPSQSLPVPNSSNALTAKSELRIILSSDSRMKPVSFIPLLLPSPLPLFQYFNFDI